MMMMMMMMMMMCNDNNGDDNELIACIGVFKIHCCECLFGALLVFLFYTL